MSDIFDVPKMYYDIKVNQFRKYIKPVIGGHIVGDSADYYADSQREGRTVVQISDSYFSKNLVEVGNVDEFAFAEYVDGIGWRTIKQEATQ